MPSTDTDRAARIRDAAAEVIAKHRIPGISIGVVRGDELVFCEGFGQADILERLKSQSIDSTVGTPDELAAHIKTEYARYSKLIKAVGLKVE